MAEAFFWGFVASISLLLGGTLASLVRVKKRLLGLIMAFGVGALISAVAYELVEEAFSAVSDTNIIALGLMSGALLFFVADLIIGKFGGNHRKRPGVKHQPGRGGIVLLGTVVDSIPESMVIGLTIVRGGAVSVFLIVAVFLSNIPESIAATTRLRASGWKVPHILGFWAVVVVASGLAALLGYTFFSHAPVALHAYILALAGGAVLTMLADTMMPEAFQDSGKLVGLATTLGFGLAFALSTLR